MKPQQFAENILREWDGESTILIGEDHVNPAHKAVQESIVEKVSPDFLLHEALKQKEPKEVNLNSWPLTLQDLEEHHSHRYPESSELIRVEYSEILENSRDNVSWSETRDFEIPENVEELAQMPFYRMENSFIRGIADAVREKMFESMDEFQKWSKYDRSEIDKDYFYHDEEISDLKEIHEYLQDFHGNEFDPRSFHIHYMTQISPETEFAGADQDPDITEVLYNPVRDEGVEDFDYENLVREIAMAERTDEYSSDSNNVVVILGENHIENVSSLMDSTTFNVGLESEYMENDDFQAIKRYNERG